MKRSAILVIFLPVPFIEAIRYYSTVSGWKICFSEIQTPLGCSGDGAFPGFASDLVCDLEKIILCHHTPLC